MATAMDLVHCIDEISKCSTAAEGLEVLDTYGLSDQDSLYCCLLVSCINRSEITLLNKQLDIAERAIFSTTEKGEPKI